MAKSVGRNVRLLQAKYNESGVPKILILDPRQFQNNIISNDTKSKAVEIFVVLKKFSEKWFSHVLLLAFLILYACIGAAIFESVEGGFEKKQNAIVRQLREPINNMTNLLTKLLWNERLKYPMPRGDGVDLILDSRWDNYARITLSRFETEVNFICKRGLVNGISQDTEITKWTFMGGLFFSMTVFTTIGYGDNPPKTTQGQAITMVYAFIGIPLLLMVLADMGRMFTRGIKFVLKYIRRLYYMRSLRKVRRVGRNFGDMGRRATVQMQSIKYKDTAVSAFNKATNMAKSNDSEEEEDNKITKPIGLRKSPAFVYKGQKVQKGQKGKIPFIIKTNPTPPQTSTQSSPPETPMPEDYLEIDDEFNIPISLSIFILMLYLLIGAIIFWTTERWTLLHAFYFVFISMSTIGFGDFVPGNQNVLLGAFIYLLFGLALTSMCINVVQIKLSATFQKAKIMVGESIGLDAEQIMAEEIAAENKEKEKEKEKERSRDRSIEKSSKESSQEKTLDEAKPDTVSAKGKSKKVVK